MKKLVVVIVIVAGFLHSASAQYQLKNIFRGYMNDDDVLSMSFGGELVDYVFPDSLQIRSSIDHIDVLLFSERDRIKKDDAIKVKVALSKDGYENLMKIKTPSGFMVVYGIDADDYLSGLYLNMNMGDKSGYILLKGKIYFNELEHLNASKAGSILKGL